jgi:hypothetical protein
MGFTGKYGVMKPWIVDVCGSHSTGKSTLIDAFLRRVSLSWDTVRFNVVESYSRKHILAGGGGYQKTTTSDQLSISCVNWVEILHSASQMPFTICTDLAIRSFAYALSSSEVNLLGKRVHQKFAEFANSVLFNSIVNVVWFYVPIEFSVVGDGLRDTDEEFRKMVDEAIQIGYRGAGIRPITLTGSVDQRVSLMIEHLRAEGLFRNL